MTLLLLALGCAEPCPCDSGVEPAPVGALGDALEHRSQSNTPSFWETTDVVVVDDAAYTCTGVQGLDVHDIRNPDRVRLGQAVPLDWMHPRYSRCTHLDALGDRLVVSAHADEIQPIPGIALLDVSDALSPQVLRSRAFEGLQVEQVALIEAGIAVAAHDDGLVLLDHELAEVTRVQLGNVVRVARFGDGVVAATSAGEVVRLDGALVEQERWTVPGLPQALLDVDGALVVALGSAGLWVDGVTVDTHGTALRLSRFGSGEVLVANWSDVRVYDVADEPVLVAVDGVPQAGDRPRILAAGAAGCVAVVGEWEGVHALKLTPGLTSPEITVSTERVKAPEEVVSTTVVRVWNEGQRVLVGHVDAPEGWQAAPGSFELEPGAEFTLSLTSDGTASGAFVVSTNDVDEPEIEIQGQVGGRGLSVGDDARAFSYRGLNTGEIHTLEPGTVTLLSYFATF
jgi:hypothetical protein